MADRMHTGEAAEQRDDVETTPQDHLAELVAHLVQATPEEVSALLAAHPGMRDAVLAAAHRLRGNAFVQSVLQKRAAPEVARTEQVPAQHPKEPAPVADPERQKHITRAKSAAWDQLAAGPVDERANPDEIRLPANIVRELDRAWQDSLATPRQREQGGNLVRNSGGGYAIRRSQNESDRFFDQDDNDVGWRQKLVAQVHTHPYRDDKDRVPEQFATFSEGDFDSLARSDAHMSVLRSGPYTFVLTKTKQFMRMVNALDNDEQKLAELAAKMSDTYNRAFNATKGSFSEQAEAGVMAVCEAFHLVYYVGEGADLTRRTAPARS